MFGEIADVVAKSHEMAEREFTASVREELCRALAMWKRWHNVASRRWVKACLRALRT